MHSVWQCRSGPALLHYLQLGKGSHNDAYSSATCASTELCPSLDESFTSPSAQRANHFPPSHATWHEKGSSSIVQSNLNRWTEPLLFAHSACTANKKPLSMGLELTDWDWSLNTYRKKTTEINQPPPCSRRGWADKKRDTSAPQRSRNVHGLTEVSLITSALDSNAGQAAGYKKFPTLPT